MPRKKANIHYIYKTTCTVTGRYYIGMHSTSNLEDGYLGSGKRLRYSIRKYGKENHIREILEFFDSRELLIEAEKKIITTEMLCDVQCMNIMSGGTGGFTVEQQRLNNKKSYAKQQLLRLDADWVRKRKINSSNANIKGYKDGKRIKKYFYNWNGKTHSDETKEMLSKMRKGTGTKENNSQYGTCWITNGIENKKIKREDTIPVGWYKGRK